MDVAVVLFTSDLRLRDQPALHAAQRAADAVVPLFVRDPAVDRAGFAAPNRLAFLADALADLDGALRERGGHLVLREGDVVEQVCAVVARTGAGEVHLSGGVSGFARHREERLRRELERLRCPLRVHDGVVTVVPPGAVVPGDRDHFAVFTPYFRRWRESARRDPLPAPRRVRVADGVRGAALPERRRLAGVSPGVPEGGEREGRRRMAAWLRSGVDAYEERHDDLAGDATSRLSPYLHFGCLSAAELAGRAREHGGPGAEAFERQLAWRDFHHQVLAARPGAAWRDYRARGDRWRRAGRDADAWRAGRTGYPIVDAAMRQLAHEGWMHNRGRLLVGSFLTKTLYTDWRVGARHFLELLVDGDLANNQLNWQWVAGTGTDTRPNRVLNPAIQGRRYDPDGGYVRRWVPELEGVPVRALHEPWRLEAATLRERGYPEPIVDLSAGRDRFLAARGR
ncbi:cryptochrome/photolyase family protein [Streptomyces sp. NPDC059853]|uniref:cryptochrome/photolyase family protein n=1 Tax=Streptomyces sp. NPDC059853 TaxID=3346973 RepID=UPI0036479252